MMVTGDTKIFAAFIKARGEIGATVTRDAKGNYGKYVTLAALTLATAESMTCGRIQARIGAISGASKFFLGGITTYTIDQKVHHLGVDRALAESCNAVSSEIAEQMAIFIVEVLEAIDIGQDQREGVLAADQPFRLIEMQGGDRHPAALGDLADAEFARHRVLHIFFFHRC